RARRIPRAGQRYARYRVTVLQLTWAGAELRRPVRREGVPVVFTLVSSRDIQRRLVDSELRPVVGDIVVRDHVGRSKGGRDVIGRRSGVLACHAAVSGGYQCGVPGREAAATASGQRIRI